MRVAGYTRVSTQEQAKNGYSIDEQATKIQDYCAIKEWDLVEVYSDPGYTGTNYDRPALQRMLSETDRFDMVLVFRLDRLSRSQEGALHLVNDLKGKGVAFNSISENFDTSTPIGQAMLGIAAAFAQLDHDTILERMALGKEGRAKKGLWRGGSSVPIGYDYKDGQLVINEDGATQVRKVYELYLSGYSMNAISRYMLMHYGTAYNTWSSPVCALRVLKNPLYKGWLCYKGELIKGQHEAIIEPRMWDNAQALYRSRYDTLGDHQKNPHIARHLLTGLIYCPSCGARYITHTSISGGKHYTYYTCHNRRKKQCMSTIIREEKADAIVVEEILKLDFEQPPERLPEDHSREIAKIDRQISKLIDLYTIDGISQKDLTARIEKLNEQKASLQKVPEVRMELPSKETVHDILSNGTFREKKDLVDSLVDKIEIKGDDFHIYWSW